MLTFLFAAQTHPPARTSVTTETTTHWSSRSAAVSTMSAYDRRTHAFHTEWDDRCRTAIALDRSEEEQCAAGMVLTTFPQSRTHDLERLGGIRPALQSYALALVTPRVSSTFMSDRAPSVYRFTSTPHGIKSRNAEVMQRAQLYGCSLW